MATKRSLRRFFSLRTILFLSSFLAFVGVIYAGTTVPISSEDADAVREQLDQLPTEFTPLAGAIFLNNIRWGLIGFVPFVIGTLFMLFVALGTGVSVAALATTGGQSALSAFAFLFLFPFTWMELIAYALAASEGLYVTVVFARPHLRRRLRAELRNLAVIVAVVVALLAAGALVEAFLVVVLQ